MPPPSSTSVAEEESAAAATAMTLLKAPQHPGTAAAQNQSTAHLSARERWELLYRPAQATAAKARAADGAAGASPSPYHLQRAAEAKARAAEGAAALALSPPPSAPSLSFNCAAYVPQPTPTPYTPFSADEGAEGSGVRGPSRVAQMMENTRLAADAFVSHAGEQQQRRPSAAAGPRGLLIPFAEGVYSFADQRVDDEAGAMALLQSLVTNAAAFDDDGSQGVGWGGGGAARHHERAAQRRDSLLQQVSFLHELMRVIIAANEATGGGSDSISSSSSPNTNANDENNNISNNAVERRGPSTWQQREARGRAEAYAALAPMERRLLAAFGADAAAQKEVVEAFEEHKRREAAAAAEAAREREARRAYLASIADGTATPQQLLAAAAGQAYVGNVDADGRATSPHSPHVASAARAQKLSSAGIVTASPMGAAVGIRRRVPGAPLSSSSTSGFINQQGAANRMGPAAVEAPPAAAGGPSATHRPPPTVGISHMPPRAPIVDRPHDHASSEGRGASHHSAAPPVTLATRVDYRTFCRVVEGMVFGRYGF